MVERVSEWELRHVEVRVAERDKNRVTFDVLARGGRLYASGIQRKLGKCCLFFLKVLVYYFLEKVYSNALQKAIQLNLLTRYPIIR